MDIPGSAIVGVQASVLSLPFGFMITETFAASNVVQIVSLVLLFPAAKLLTMRDLLLWVGTVIGIAGSPTWLQLIHHVQPNWAQVAFFILATTQIFIAVRIAPYIDVRRSLRAPINLAALLLAIIGAYQFLTSGLTFLDLYFQDKSHAAVTAYGLAFLVLWVNDGLARFLLAGAVYTVAVATASRLVVLGAPFFALALIIEYWRTRPRHNNALGALGHDAMLLLIPFGAIQVFRSGLSQSLTDRMANLADASTSAHIEFINLGAALKFSDPWIAAFGVGPGGFAAGVRAQGLSLSALGQVDPGAYFSMTSDAYTPVHSANLAVLVEFPAWVAISFVALWIAVFRGLRLASQRTLLLMAVGIVAVTTFYSSHNEYFYTVYLSILALAAFARPRRRQHG